MRIPKRKLVGCIQSRKMFAQPDENFQNDVLGSGRIHIFLYGVWQYLTKIKLSNGQI